MALSRPAAEPSRPPASSGQASRPGTELEFPRYTPAERRADAAVHVLGLALGLTACSHLLVTALPGADLEHLVGLGLYALGLMTMLGCSALYNLTGVGSRKALFHRLDHAAIFLMIAGTYTPFALLAIGGAWGAGLLAFVWSVAGSGITLTLLGLQRQGLLIAAYLGLGWTVLAALGPLVAAVSPSGVVLLAAGGILYSLGVGVHLWRQLPYQNAIWHGFVLAAAACHYLAVLRQV